MADMMDDIAHLSHEIGPRPAGTEEEQQAALYIADELQKSAGFSTVVEDVSCASSGNTVRLVCFLAGFITTLLSLIFSVLGIPCFLIGAIAAVLFLCEALGKSVLSRFLRNGVSQNVVAKYNPLSITKTNKRRKIVVVAHYDSARVATEYQGIVGQYLPIIRLVTAIALLVAPVLLLIKTVFFAGQPGGLAVVFTVLQVICLILMALPLIGIIKSRISPYNEAANNDAAGIAVLLDVARTVGNGLVSADTMEDSAREAGVQVHGEKAAREAGVMPEGVEVEYQTRDRSLTPEESLAAAKAAIAAFTGKPVADKVPVSDISSRLVRHGEFFDTAEDAAAAAMHFEVEEPDEKPAYVPSEPVGEIPGVRYSVEERIVDPQMAAQADAENDQAEESFMRDSVEALQPGATGMAGSYQKQVPAWAKAAQEKAHANRPDLMDATGVSRSRFADAPAAKMFETPVQPTNAAFVVAAEPAEEPAEEQVVVEGAQEATYQEPQSDLAKRLAAMREEINDAAAPMLKKVEQAAKESSANAAAAEQPEPVAEATPIVAVMETEEEEEAFEEPSVSEEPAAPKRSRRGAAPKNNIGGFLGRASQMVSNVSSKVGGNKDQKPTRQRLGKKNNVEQPVIEDQEAVFVDMVQEEPGGATTAMPPIDVSQYVDETLVQEEQVFTEVPAFDAEEAPAQQPEAQEAVVQEEAAEAAEPVAPIVGMEAMTSVMPVVQQETIVTEEDSAPDKHVIVLPDVVAPVATSLEDAKQRAPMAAGLESTQSQSQALLSNMLPQIDPLEGASSGEAAGGRLGGLNLPDFSTSDFERVSADYSDDSKTSVMPATGKAGNTGSFASVGNDIIEENYDAYNEEVFVDDADDSVFDEGFTQTGAFAGPDYVEMPKSRVGRLFGRFGKKKKQEEQSMREWVNVDESYEARSVGRERGSWESFRNEDDDVFTDVDFAEDDFDNGRGWNGGAFSLQSLRNRVSGAPTDQPVEEYDEEDFVVTPDLSAPMRAVPEDVKITEEINNEMRRLRDFRHPDIDTEVWFVALGAEEAMNSGMKAFIEEHRQELKGAIIVNLEGLGAGKLSFIDEEGEYRPNKVSSRMKRILREAADRSGIGFATNKLLSRNTAAHVAAQNGFQAMTLAGMDGNQTAYYGSIDDTVSNIDPVTLDENSSFVLELLKSV